TLATIACSLGLALPPGWCCMVSPSGTAVDSAAVAPEGVAAQGLQTVSASSQAAPAAPRSCCRRGIASHPIAPAKNAAGSQVLAEQVLGQPLFSGCQHARTPQVRCCCTRDAAVRERLVDMTDNALTVATVTDTGL